MCAVSTCVNSLAFSSLSQLQMGKKGPQERLKEEPICSRMSQSRNRPLHESRLRSDQAGFKHKFNEDEDKQIINWVLQHGKKDWNFLARLLPGRTQRSVRQRYVDYLDPMLEKDDFRDQQRFQLWLLRDKMNLSWAQCSKKMTGRCGRYLKNKSRYEKTSNKDRFAKILAFCLEKKGLKRQEDVARQLQKQEDFIRDIEREMSMQLVCLSAVSEKTTKFPWNQEEEQIMLPPLVEPALFDEQSYQKEDLGSLINRSPFGMSHNRFSRTDPEELKKVQIKFALPSQRRCWEVPYIVKKAVDCLKHLQIHRDEFDQAQGKSEDDE